MGVHLGKIRGVVGPGACRGSCCKQRDAACRAKQRHCVYSGIGAGDRYLVELREAYTRTGGKGLGEALR